MPLLRELSVLTGSLEAVHCRGFSPSYWVATPSLNSCAVWQLVLRSHAEPQTPELGKKAEQTHSGPWQGIALFSGNTSSLWSRGGSKEARTFMHGPLGGASQGRGHLVPRQSRDSGALLTATPAPSAASQIPESLTGAPSVMLQFACLWICSLGSTSR